MKIEKNRIFNHALEREGYSSIGTIATKYTYIGYLKLFRYSENLIDSVLQVTYEIMIW